MTDTAIENPTESGRERSAYQSCLAEMMGLPDDDVRRVNLDIRKALTTVKEVGERLLTLRAEMLTTLADFDIAKLDKLETYALALLQADINYGVAEDTRDRAFTLFVQAYGQMRRAVQYLRWQYRDADQYAPSLYRRRRARRATSSDAADARDTQTQELLAVLPDILEALNLLPELESAQYALRQPRGTERARPSSALGKPKLRLVRTGCLKVKSPSAPAGCERTQSVQQARRRRR
jgi:hypothetical protein